MCEKNDWSGEEGAKEGEVTCLLEKTLECLVAVGNISVISVEPALPQPGWRAGQFLAAPVTVPQRRF